MKTRRRLKKAVKEKLALFISIVMMITLAPMNVFANGAEGRQITSVAINNPVNELFVEYGTPMEALGLPDSANVHIVETDEEENAIESDETVGITWTGAYDGNTAGTYVLQSEFTDSAYAYDNMPSVNVTVNATPVVVNEEAPVVEEEPAVEETPVVEETAAPEETVVPEVTATPEETAEPEVTPEATVVPEETEEPEATTTPDSTFEIEADTEETPAFEETVEPEATATPETIEKPMPVMLAGAKAEDYNLYANGKITGTIIEVKPKDAANFISVENLGDKELHIGDEVHIQFNYGVLTEVTTDQIYYIPIPSGVSEITESSSGKIKNGNDEVGDFWVEDGKIKLRFQVLLMLRQKQSAVTSISMQQSMKQL